MFAASLLVCSFTWLLAPAPTAEAGPVPGALFWPASALHVAALWRWGPKVGPAVFLASLLGGRLLGLSWVEGFGVATGHLAEALLFVGVWLFAGAGARTLHTLRGVLGFLAAALLAPLVGTLIEAVVLRAGGGLRPGADFLGAVADGTVAKAAGIVLLVPVLLLGPGGWRTRPLKRELFLWVLLGGITGWIAFPSFFLGDTPDRVFLIFPFVLCAALRFGAVETAGALACLMALMQAAFVAHAPLLAPDRLEATLWFAQAFAVALGASGLLLSALTTSRAETELQLGAEQLRRRESAAREESARLESLRYQMRPHFLFNSLNSIRAVAADAASREMLTELSDYLRATLERSGADRVCLREEIRCARSYLAVERMRHGEELRVDFDFAPDTLDRIVPIFLLQPLVENAVRHGFEQTRGAFHLVVSARLVAGGLRLEVANTGRWRPGSPEEGGGLGLGNVRRRLALVHGDAAKLSVADGGGWVRVQVEITDGCGV